MKINKRSINEILACDHGDLHIKARGLYEDTLDKDCSCWYEVLCLDCGVTGTTTQGNNPTYIAGFDFTKQVSKVVAEWRSLGEGARR